MNNDGKAVFLSYAHDDAAAVLRIAGALRAAGVEVWFDQNELVGGDAWDQKIRNQVKSCALFVPVISATTQARTEGYFRREWNLAAARMLDMARGKPFLLPIVIDGTKESEAVVPGEFIDIQWTRLPAGETPAAFVQRVQGLLGSTAAPKPISSAEQAAPPAPSVASRRGFPSGATAASNGRSRRRTLALAAGGAALAALIGISVWFLRPKSAAPGGEFHTVPLTANAGFESNPSFSPDGNQVAYSWNGEKQDNFDIYLKLIGAGAPLRLTTDPASDRSPAWSPDGRWIAFVRIPSSGAGDVILIPVLGGPERRIADISVPRDYLYDSHLAWTRNGKWLIASYAESKGESAGLFLLSPETGEKRRLTTGTSQAPAVSPNGRRLAFVMQTGMSVGELHVCDLSDDFAPQREPIRLTTLKQALASPAWTPDGREIVFSSGAHLARRSLWRITASPGNTPQPEPTGEDGRSLSIAPLGRRLAYSRVVNNTDIWRITLRNRTELAGPPARFIASTRIDGNPAYSPDGKRIAFNSHRSGAQEVWLANADGANPLQLTTASGPMVADPRWSPDGQMLAIHSMRGGVRGIDLISSSGGAFKRLVDGGGLWPTWSRDGKWVYFGKDDQLWKIPLGGGAAIQVSTTGASGNAFETADGEFLYYTKGTRIWRVPLGGGSETQILDERLSADQNFALTENGLYMIAAPDFDSPGSLYFFDFATSRLTPLLTIPRLWLGLAVSPDRQSILYSQREQDSGSLMVVENFR